ncbi:MAG: UDP-galactopyranose mutase [Coriobacteriales bacterium]|nr:UDP-galactopyranose mutase [Coriobacteriales bacterium]
MDESIEEPIKLTDSDVIVVGAGFAGATIARELAERGGQKVSIIERRSHIGGNAYDCLDDRGVLIHAYGPHIYHTNSERVHEFLSRFTEWNGYNHKVLADIHDKLVPVPFNLNSIQACFPPELAKAYRQALLAAFPLGSKVGILELMEKPEPLLRELATYVYENVFLHYTMKQWGLKPDAIDPAVTARVPVLVDYDDRYFQDTYQGLPTAGYTPLFEAMLDHPGISVHKDVDAREVLSLDNEADFWGHEWVNEIFVNNRPYDGRIIYTGALDELCGWYYGLLPYRSLDFSYRQYNQKHVQPVGTINYTVSQDYTRTTEYSWLTCQDIDVTTVAEEYPRAFNDPASQIPYYPVIAHDNQLAYQRYLDLFADLPKFHLLGRLAEYRYYNMDQIVERALLLADQLLG